MEQYSQRPTGAPQAERPFSMMARACSVVWASEIINDLGISGHQLLEKIYENFVARGRPHNSTRVFSKSLLCFYMILTQWCSTKWT